MIKKLLLYIIFLFLLKSSHSQNQSGYIKEGNNFFKDGKLESAITSYSRVTDGKYKYTALLNKGTALYKLKQYDDAIKTYGQISASKQADVLQRSAAYYNTGVVYSNQQKTEESIKAYKNALRLNSHDNDARENLQKALSELRKKSGGGGGEKKPKPAASTLNKSQAQKELDRLEQKEKQTQKKVSGKKAQYSGSNGKDW